MDRLRQHLIVGTRTSELARWQSNYVVSLLSQKWPGMTCELRSFDTKGDRMLDRPLPEIGGKGIFTAELERALLSGEIDIAVHSLKDLPVQNTPGLTIGAIPARDGVTDALVNGNDETLTTLRPGSVVGTSSLRRQAQILAARPDLQVRSIRGNIGTRARKVLNGDYDAVVLAAAGIKRLKMEHLVSDWLPLEIMLPAPGQGALGVQCRTGDKETLALLGAIECADARRATTAERHFLQALGGGCSAPIAAHATDHGGMLQMVGLIATPDGSKLIRVSGHGKDARALAEELAAQARHRGAGSILAALQPAGTTIRAAPLQGLRVVVTRSRAQAPEFVRRLRDLGATPILFPTIRIAPVDDSAPLDNAIQTLHDVDWVIFTSVNGVDVFWERLEALGKDSTIFDSVRVAAIGPATGEALVMMGVIPDFIPAEFVAERIAEGLGDVSGLKILLPRAQEARATLASLLQPSGARVHEIATYRTVYAAPDPGTRDQLDGADVLTFTSSSTVRNFVSLVGGPQAAARLASKAVIACIGPITAQTARELGMDPQIVAANYTIDGLIAALLAYYQ